MTTVYELYEYIKDRIQEVILCLIRAIDVHHCENRRIIFQFKGR